MHESNPTTAHDLEAQPTFDALPLSEPVRRAVDEAGYVHPTPVQLATYEPAVEGRDLIAQAQTGTGKTAAFALPLVDRIIEPGQGVQALILAPTRELALQISRETERLGKHRELRTVAVYGGAPMGKQIDALAAGAEIVSGTPGRVLDHLDRGTFDASGLKVLVLDEMDEMLSMGFARELNAILERLPPKRQNLCFSATVDAEMRRLAERHMHDPELLSLSTDEVGAARITHYVYLVSGTQRTADLIRILEAEDPESAIIFCNLRAETERVAADLKAAGFNADWLNGDLPQREREKIMARTREGKLRYLVATDVAARGIDVSHLTHVINYAFPEAPAQYVHRTGRTGRAGRTGTAISLVSPHEIGRLYYLRLQYKIFPIERSLPTSGEIETRREADRIAMLEEAFKQTPSSGDLAVARRLLTHPEAERILAGLLSAFFGPQESEADEQAAAARRARAYPVKEPATSPKREPRKAGRDEAEKEPRRRRTRRRSTKKGRDEEAAEAKGGHDERTAGATGGEDVATLCLHVGREQGVRPGEVARLLYEQCGLTRKEVGRIRIRDDRTLVGVPSLRADEVLQNLEGQALREHPLEAERAEA